MAKIEKNEFNLTEQKSRFIEYHFSGDYQSVGDAYIAAGFSENSASQNGSRILASKEGRRYLNVLRQKAYDRVVNKFLRKSLSMLNVLVSIAEDKNNSAAARSGAARSVIDFAQKGYESTVQDEKMLELEARLDAITGNS